jgi:acetoin utilization deacetylase AcuC-like enzyme
MSNRRANPVDPLIRLFREVSGDVPDGASLARMHRVSSALNLHDNDALWSIIAVLEYYVRMYETMPERIRWASEGSLEAARREVGGAIDALMQQHRDALERCKGTIQLAEKLIQEHEERYQAALAQLNDERMSTQVARTAGNRLIGVAAVAAREQRERLDSAVSAFGQAIEAATERVEAMATRMERRFARSMNRLLLVGVAVLCLLLTTGLVS